MNRKSYLLKTYQFFFSITIYILLPFIFINIKVDEYQANSVFISNFLFVTISAFYNFVALKLLLFKIHILNCRDV